MNFLPPFDLRKPFIHRLEVPKKSTNNNNSNRRTSEETVKGFIGFYSGLIVIFGIFTFKNYFNLLKY